jgi:hypothetical protein
VTLRGRGEGGNARLVVMEASAREANDRLDEVVPG